MTCIFAFIIGGYILYESVEVATGDNRCLGFFRGVRYVLTASYGLMLVFYAVADPQKLDWMHILAGGAIALRMLHDLERRVCSYIQRIVRL